MKLRSGIDITSCPSCGRLLMRAYDVITRMAHIHCSCGFTLIDHVTEWAALERLTTSPTDTAPIEPPPSHPE